MKLHVTIAVLLIVGALGCADTGPRVMVTSAPEVDAIPTTVAVYPLLTTEVRYPSPIRHPRPDPKAIELHTYRDGDPGRNGEEDGGIYISPPTESKLVVTGHSQLFSDLLAADMAHNGFKIKQLPVEAPLGADDHSDGQQFYVSMDLLHRLQSEFGLEAVLLGNVYFEPHRYNPGDVAVTAVYVKVVDVNTLDVLCHISISGGLYGSDVADVVAEVAAELAGLAAQPVKQAVK